MSEVKNNNGVSNDISKDIVNSKDVENSKDIEKVNKSEQQPNQEQESKLKTKEENSKKQEEKEEKAEIKEEKAETNSEKQEKEEKTETKEEKQEKEEKAETNKEKTENKEEVETKEEEAETNEEKIELKEEKLEQEEEPKKKILTKKRVIIACASTLMTLVVASIVFIFYTYKKLNFVDFDKQDYKEETFDIESEEEKQRKADEELKAEQIKFDEIKGNPIYDENIINILLVGDDQKTTDEGHGNSDSMMILSIDKTSKKVKVVSLMRDMYLPIAEGYSNNKINAAYGIGGVSLLKKTIEKNFKIPIDGAVVVHFDTFPKLIDKLGGVRVKLNKEEAEYINHKLAKDDIDSNLIEGDVSLNGDQTLWFSRIRKVSSDIYGRDDFGRTCRQRYVLDQLFEKYKKMDYMDIYSTVDELSNIIDIDEKLKDKVPVLAQMVSKFEADKIENMRLPLDDAYTDARVFIGSNSVMVLNVSSFMKKNVEELHMFLYGRKNIEENKDDDKEDKECLDANNNSENRVNNS